MSKKLLAAGLVFHQKPGGFEVARVGGAINEIFGLLTWDVLERLHAARSKAPETPDASYTALRHAADDYTSRFGVVQLRRFLRLNANAAGIGHVVDDMRAAITAAMRKEIDHG
jgi:hypothetical protein